MQPTYYKSIIKETIREQNLMNAEPAVERIRADLKNKLDGYGKNMNNAVIILIVFLIVGLVLMFTVKNAGVILGLFVMIAGLVLFLCRTKKIKADDPAKRAALEAQANMAIQREYDKANQLTLQMVAAYENEVNMYTQKVLADPSVISSMTSHTVRMFQQMISRASRESHIKFIEAEITFNVEKTGIIYTYKGSIINSGDNFEFAKNHFKPLKSDAECEGLAQAITKLVLAEMKKHYPPNSTKISMSHFDASVTLNFRAPNKNYIPSVNIV